MGGSFLRLLGSERRTFSLAGKPLAMARRNMLLLRPALVRHQARLALGPQFMQDGATPVAQSLPLLFTPQVYGTGSLFDPRLLHACETEYRLKVTPDSGSLLVITGVPAGSVLYAGTDRIGVESGGTITITPPGDGLGVMLTPSGDVRVRGLAPGSARWKLRLVAAQEPVCASAQGSRSAVSWLSASDSVTQTERVQSRIPVRDWQTGLSYYNNYGSQKPGTETPNGPVDVTGQDGVRALDASLVSKSSFKVRGENVLLGEAFVRGGRSGKVASDFVTSGLETGVRHGLWSIRWTDSVGVTERAEVHGRFAKKLSDSVTVRELGINPQYNVTDRVTASERAEQHGRRAYVVSDQVYHYERGANSNHRVEDTLLLSETWRKGGRTAIKVADQVGAQDTGRQSGRRVFSAQDQVGVADVGYQRGGLRVQRVKLAFTMQDAARNAWVKLGDTVTESGRFLTDRTMSRRDTVGVTESGRLTNRNQLGSEQVTVSESGRQGRREITAAEQVTAGLTGRTGNRVLSRQEGVYTLEASRFARRTDQSRAEPVTLVDTGRMSVVSPSRPAAVLVSDFGEQHGRRAQLGSETPRLTDAGVLTNVRPRVSDPVRVTERGHQSNPVPLGRDAASVSDSGRQSGRRVFTGQDSLTMTEASAGRRGRWAITERETLSVALTARSAFPAQAERVTVTQRQHSDRFFSRRDTVEVTDYREKFLRDVTLRETVTLADKARPHWLVTSRGEVPRLTETWDLHGKLQWLRQDPVTLNSPGVLTDMTPKVRDRAQLVEDWKLSNQTPVRSDQVTADSRAERHGKLALKVGDQVGVALEHQGVHGRSAFRLSDRVIIKTGVIYPPRNFLVSEPVRVREATDHFFASDRILLLEGKELDNVLDVPVMTDRGVMVNLTPRASDSVSLTDRRHVIRDQRVSDKLNLKETRVLTREFSVSEPLSLGEHHRLLRPADFLNLNPDEYLERTRRRRFAARVSRQLDGNLIAAWLEGGLVYVARSPHPTVWKGRTVTSFPAPAGARQVAVSADGSVTTSDGLTLFTPAGERPGTDPAYLGDGLFALSVDRRTLLTPDGEFPLARRGFLRQTFAREGGGVLVVDDLDRPLWSAVPAPYIDQEDRASARWVVRGPAVTRTLNPIEGDVKTLDAE